MPIVIAHLAGHETIRSLWHVYTAVVSLLALPTVKQFGSNVLQSFSLPLKESRCFTVLLAGQGSMLMGTQAAPHACTSPHSLHTLALLHCHPLADCELPWADEGLDGTLLLPDGLACNGGTFVGPVSTAWLSRPVQAEPFCPAAAVGLDPSERLTAARSGRVGSSWMAALASGPSTLLTAGLLPGFCNVTGASGRNKTLGNPCSALQ